MYYNKKINWIKSYLPSLKQLTGLCMLAIMSIVFYYRYNETDYINGDNNQDVIIRWENFINQTSINITPKYLYQSHQEINSKLIKKPFTEFPKYLDISQLGIGSDNINDKDRYFIYRCDRSGMRNCGGYTNRLKGMIAAYLIANITGRTFKMEYLDPTCNFLNYLIPNKVNWNLPNSFHDDVGGKKDVQIINKIDKADFYWNLKNIDFKKLVSNKYKYAYFKVNQEYLDGFRNQTVHRHTLSWMDHHTRDQIFTGLYKRLFKLSDSLEYKINYFLHKGLTSPKDKLICAQVRMGKNPSNPNDKVLSLSSEVSKVWTFLNSYNSNTYHKFFVISDSQSVINEAARQPFKDRLLVSPGEILHVERSKYAGKERICDALEKVIFEMHMLTYCNVLLVANSGLSRMAAYLRGSPHGLFCHVYGHIVPCRPDNLKDLWNDRN